MGIVSRIAYRLPSVRALRERVASLQRECDRLQARCAHLESLLPPECGSGAGAEPLLSRMRSDWDVRARLNARHFTNTAETDWEEEAYASTGEQNVREYIANDLGNICQGADPFTLRVLEIGCGAGRMTGPLAALFGEVHAVDISGEMIRVARERLAGAKNVVFHQNDGRSLAGLGSDSFDFAMSYIVFQHVPDKDVIDSYMAEVRRVLKPGRLFKFQLQGAPMTGAPEGSTWYGASYTRAECEALAARNGFELRYAVGEGTTWFWLWFFKR